MIKHDLGKHVSAKFIVVEGMEGAGKSTNLQFICDHLNKKSIRYTLTREPGGTPVAEKIRDLLLQPQSEDIAPLAELLLIFAARAQHIKKVILPALSRGEWVVSDRFTDATYAYQGAGRELGVEKVELLEHFVQQELRPDRVIVLDVPYEVGMRRINQRGELDRFEREPQAFFEKVRNAYHQRAVTQPERYALVDASRALEDVQASLASVLDALC